MVAVATQTLAVPQPFFHAQTPQGTEQVPYPAVQLRHCHQSMCILIQREVIIIPCREEEDQFKGVVHHIEEDGEVHRHNSINAPNLPNS